MLLRRAQVKVWNVRSRECIRTMECGFGLCATFLPGDRHVVVGCKDGTLRLFDLASGEALQALQAHQGAVWSMCLRPDGKGMMTGSADHTVKFWEVRASRVPAGSLALMRAVRCGSLSWWCRRARPHQPPSSCRWRTCARSR